MNRRYLKHLFFALCTAVLLQTSPRAQHPVPLFYEEGPGVVQELVTGLIDYASLRLAMEAKPDMLRKEIEACGACERRALLEQKLAFAERDRAIIGAIEAGVAKSMGMGHWQARKLGIRAFPDHVLAQPQPCIALWDKKMTCQIEHDDKDAYRISSPCYPQFQLHKLCAEGKAGPFNDYVRFLKRKSDGEFVSEASDKYRQVRYYNVKPDTLFPLEPIEFGDGVRSLGIKVDNTALHSLRHVSIGASSYPSYFMIGLMFREPWSKIVDEDATAIGRVAIYLKCEYVAHRQDYWVNRLFWYRERPKEADPDYLKSRMKDHPFLFVGDPREQCPATPEEAKLAGNQLDRDEQTARYKGMLKSR